MISNTLYARWKPGKIQIDYMADGNGTVSSRETADDKKTAYEIVNLDVDNPNNLDIGGAIAEAGTGYHFVNWTNSMDSQTGKYDSLARGDILSVIRDNTGAYHPVTFIAHFAANQYNVRYFANGGEGSLDDMRATYGVYLQLAVGGTVEGIFREGYSFAGWNTKADGSGTSYKSGGRVNDFVGDHGSTITLYAMWAELETRIEFTAAPVAGGVVPVTDTVPEGMTGVSWITVDDDHINLVDDNDLDHVVASWTRTTLGWTLAIKRVSGAATAAAAALRGYEFVEWIDASTGQVVSTDARFTPLRAEGASSWPATLAFIATFKSNTFNIAFDANEGERAPDSVTALFGNQLRLPTTAGSGTEGTTGMSREGYKFVGWNTKKNGTGTWFKDAELIDGDSVNHLVDGIDDIQDTIVTLYAQWEPLKYLVSFRPGADDATGSMAALELIYGVSGKLPTNSFARPGYDFAGWAEIPSASSAKYADGATVFNLSVDGRTFTLFAVWTPRNFSVSFNTSNSVHGTVSSGGPVDVLYNDHLTESQIPGVTANAPYQFSHWSYVMKLAAGGTVTGIAKNAAELTILGDVVFTAVFRDDSHYNVRYFQGEHGVFADVENSTYWIGLTTGTAFPKYAGTVDDIDSNARNYGLPSTSPGWKWIGWTWTIDGVTYSTVKGDALPTTVTCSLSITAIFAKTGQVLSFDANGGTVTSAGASSMSATRYETALRRHCPALTRSRARVTSSPAGAWRRMAPPSTRRVRSSPCSPRTRRCMPSGKPTPTRSSSTPRAARPLLRSPVSTSMTATFSRGIVNPTKPGYRFRGWFNGTAEGDTQIDADTIFASLAGSSAAGSIATIYARWEEIAGSISYTAVTVDATTGERTETTGGYVNNRLEQLPAVNGVPIGASAYTQPGYTFVRWIDELGNTVSWDATFVPTKGIYDPTKGSYAIWENPTKYYAVFTAHDFTVVFDVNGGTGALDSMTFTYDTSRTLPTAEQGGITRVGYDFAGWTTAPMAPACLSPTAQRSRTSPVLRAASSRSTRTGRCTPSSSRFRPMAARSTLPCRSALTTTTATPSPMTSPPTPRSTSPRPTPSFARATCSMAGPRRWRVLPSMLRRPPSRCPPVIRRSMRTGRRSSTP